MSVLAHASEISAPAVRDPLIRRHISVSLVRELFDYDPTAGLLRWKACRSNFVPNGTLAGSPGGGGRHLKVRIGRVRHLLHRVIFAHYHGYDSPFQIDHINGDKLDNRIKNLREATHTQNNANRTKRRGGQNLYKGTSFHKPSKKWVAKLKCEGVSHFLGYFDDPEAARDAYNSAAQRIFGEFARPS